MPVGDVIAVATKPVVDPSVTVTVVPTANVPIGGVVAVGVNGPCTNWHPPPDEAAPAKTVTAIF